MLVGDDVVFVFRVGRLMLRWDVDFLVGEMPGTVEFLVRLVGGQKRLEVRVSYFEEVGDAGLVQVNVGSGGVFGLRRGISNGTMLGPREGCWEGILPY